MMFFMLSCQRNGKGIARSLCDNDVHDTNNRSIEQLRSICVNFSLKVYSFDNVCFEIPYNATTLISISSTLQLVITLEGSVLR